MYVDNKKNNKPLKHAVNTFRIVPVLLLIDNDDRGERRMIVNRVEEFRIASCRILLFLRLGDPAK